MVADINVDMLLPCFRWTGCLSTGWRNRRLRIKMQQVAKDFHLTLQADPAANCNIFLRSDRYSSNRILAELLEKVANDPEMPRWNDDSFLRPIRNKAEVPRSTVPIIEHAQMDRNTAEMHSALVSDFDGTITEKDFFAVVAERHMPKHVPDFFAMYRRKEITHVEAMQRFFNFTPDDPVILEQLLKDTNPDRNLQRATEDLHKAGWDLIIVSAGSSWYIERILSRIGVEHAQVHSNPGRIVPGEGLQLDDLTRDVDKAEFVRDAQTKYVQVAFAGDGPPDFEAALLVTPGLRFARRYLADELRQRGEPFRPFESWSRDVVGCLLSPQSA
jgi:2-hydroxy-3-keto-5-methylthiopentenyl-1-phosphate phosphatase